MTLQTEYDFTLPKGYVDGRGELHRSGVMRLATARDEVEPLRDARVQQNEAYMTIIVLSRVVVRLGTITQVTPHEIEEMFASDLAYLQELYGIVNFGDAAELEAFRADHAELSMEAEPEEVDPPDESSSPPFGRRGGFIEEVAAAE